MDSSALISEISDSKEYIAENDLSFENVQDISVLLHSTFPDSYQNLKQLYRLLLIFPFSTVLCESSFSHMSQIKTAFRNALDPKNLENLLFLTLNKDSYIDYQI